MADPLTGYIHSAAFDIGKLPVSEIHTLHYEQYGKRDGKPVMDPSLTHYPPSHQMQLLYVHGGPGGSTSHESTIFFNPAIYRVVLFDQRGAGRSTPTAELRENTSQHLVSDIEVLREHLQIPKWHLVFGGSWGSTLSLLYAQAYPEMVGCMILRGIFTVRKSELEFSRGPIGAANIFPEAYEAFVNYLPEKDRARPNEAYHELLLSDDYETRVVAAREWNRWDLSIGTLRPDPGAFAQLEDDAWVLAHARLESHYFANGGFLEEGQILQEKNLSKIRHIPVTIIQGRHDIVCAAQTAWALHKGLPESRLFWIPDAGHSATESGTQAKLFEVCDEYGELDFTN
ncbi:hypothetical protein N7457_002182 [Penicillium paradoxum]|uniref:uncharacterized protein n=1 Tax=Penicillium paradoxum TaxID=176176 RepID=UPI0025473171|nr:uncharacterized protein N7457_002182 [Penicillium paradoxum]KAJ5787192.1 hypothetical protein N7457_002182 [Penicillium paradoxum]